MTVKIVQEITDWKVPYRQPNHVYLMSGDRVLAMSRWGEGRPEYFANPGRMDRRGRKFVEVKKNPWRFDLQVSVESEPEQRPTTAQTWTVIGSKGNQYTVSWDSGLWACTCPGHGFRGHCRHVSEVSASVQPQV